jgi:hypothetical protein
MADQNLSVDIKIKADTAGAKQATAAIDGVEKSVEELAKTEKEAINTNGMYLDSLGRIHDASGRFVKVAAEEREGIKERIKLQEQETGVVGRATVTGNGAAQTKREMAKAAKELEKQTTRNAMGFMALSNGLQDVQYGLGGIVNNIPQIVTGMGMGMGMAGAVQIAAVGVQFLLKNVDLFGEKAKEAAKAASELSAEAMADANAAYKAAEATKAQAAAQREFNDALAVTEGHYKAVIALSDQIIKQKQAEKDAEIALADAQAGMEMARIQLMEATGKMTKEEAIFAKDKVRIESESRKQTALTLAEETKAAELRRKAAAEDQQARAARAAAGALGAAGAGLLSPEDRKLATENRDSIKAFMEQSRATQEETAKALTGSQFLKSGMLGAGGVILNEAMIDKDRRMNEYKLQKERDAYAEMQLALDRENAKITADEVAQKKTKFTSREQLDKAIEEQAKAANEGAGRASGLRVEAMGTETGIRQSQQLFNLRQAAGSMGALAQVEAERTKQREEAQKKADQDANRRNSNLKQIGSAGGSLASTLAGDGLAPGFADSLREAAGGAGSDAGLNRLIAMVAKLTANSSKLSEQAKSKLDKLEAEIEDLRTAK